MNDLVCTELAPCVVSGRSVRCFRLANAQGMRVNLMAFGATILSVELAAAGGVHVPVTRGLATPGAYSNNAAYVGAVCGRYAGRIANASFVLEGQFVQLSRNSGAHHLHGGVLGFSSQLWRAEPYSRDSGVGVQFTYTSADGEEGYPGRLSCSVSYTLDNDSRLYIDYVAYAEERPTVVNLTNHTYWNLSDQADIYGHRLQLAGSQILEFDENTLPTGMLLPVENTAFDFIKPKGLGEQMAKLPQEQSGFDHCYVHKTENHANLSEVARVFEPVSGRWMNVYTDQPAVVFYTGNYLDGSPQVGGHKKHAAFCLECQQYPDAPNQPSFPSSVVRPGEPYTQSTIYQFGTADTS